MNNKIVLKKSNIEGVAYERGDFLIRKNGNKFELTDKYVTTFKKNFNKLYELKNFIAELNEIDRAANNKTLFCSNIYDFLESRQLRLKYYEMTNSSHVKRIENEITIIKGFISLSIKKKYVISKSPYSNSFYSHEENDVIDWGHKPLNSYRLSDHWGFGVEEHCKRTDGEKAGLCMCKITKEGYKKII